MFGDRDTGAYLAKFAWTKIVRHVPVHGWASPDDPALARYWAAGGANGYPRQRTRRPSGSCERRTAAALAAGNR